MLLFTAWGGGGGGRSVDRDPVSSRTTVVKRERKTSAETKETLQKLMRDDVSLLSFVCFCKKKF